jgi:hypothetical protein
MDFHIIDEENFRDHIHPGYQGFMPRESAVGCLEGVPLFRDAFKLIPEQEWESRVSQMEAAKAFARYIYEQQNPVAKDQDGLSFCWAYSLSQTVEVARAVTHLNYVELAPESLGELTGWRNAGFYCDKALQYAIKNGIAGRYFVPNLSLNYRQYKQGWKEDALKHCPLEYYDLGGEDLWKEVVTALLSGFSIYVGYNWWSHAVMLDQLVYVNGELCVSLPNTWGANQRRVLKGRQKYPDEAFAIRSCTFAT